MKKFFGKYDTVREMLEKESPANLEKLFPHGKPMSRRDLLKAGAIQFAASLTLPSLLETLLGSNMAHAQLACSQKPAFIGVKANGGFAVMGNWVALGSNRDFISNYSQLGLGSGSQIANRTTTVFGNALFFDQSQMLAGMQERAAATTLLNTSVVGIPVASTDDSANNPFDITYFVSKLGLQGSILPNLGRSQSLTGVAQMPALNKTPPTPLPVSSVNDISNALTVQGSIGSLNSSQKSGLFSLINRLSERQAREVASLRNGGEVLRELITQSTNTNALLVNSATSGIDPLQDATVATQFNTTWVTANNQNLNQQQVNNRERVFATMAYNALKGNAGTVNVDLGGFDYHGQGRAQQDAKDLELGRVVGQFLQSAAIMQRPVFVMVTTDGAVGAPAGSAPGAAFTGDRGQGGAILCFAYDPIQRPATLDRTGKIDHQVGQVARDAAVDTEFLTGNSPDLGGLAAFANFASFSGQLGQFQQIVGSTWNNDQIETVTRFRRK